jgi:hypothetical protein
MTVSKETKRRIAQNTARIKRLELRVMCFHIPKRQYREFKLKVRRDHATIRAVAVAMIELYLKGDLEIEEDQASAK